MSKITPSNIHTADRPAGPAPMAHTARRSSASRTGRALAQNPKAYPRLERGIRRVFRGLLVICLVGTALAGFWVHSTGIVEQRALVAEALRAEMPDLPHMPLQIVEVSGNAKIADNEIISAANATLGQDILAIPLEDIRARVESLGWVRQATISRALPSTLRIVVEEREPYALWQFKGVLRLVDREGAEITQRDLGSYAGLPQIVGRGAASHAADLLALLEGRPEIRAMFAAAIRVADRRWDIELVNDIQIMLPERGADQALDRLVQLHRQHRILERDIVSLDLRIPDRLTIRQANDNGKKIRKDQNT